TQTAAPPRESSPILLSAAPEARSRLPHGPAAGSAFPLGGIDGPSIGAWRHARVAPRRTAPALGRSSRARRRAASSSFDFDDASVEDRSPPGADQARIRRRSSDG